MKNFFLTKFQSVILVSLILTSFSIAQNWQLQNSNTISQLKGIQMISTNEGWGCGDAGAMIHTTNAGTNWSLLTLTGSDLHQLVFKDASNGIVVGDNGTIFTTTNAGTNWISKNSGTSAQLRGVGFAGSSTYFAVGDDGAAIKSTDDGNTWTNLTTGTIERFLCITAFNQNVWIGARNGLILFSNNGGTSFNSMSNPATDDIKDIQFIDGSVGFACGSNSFFMYTSNGGINWTSRSSGIQVGLNGLHFVNQNQGWTVGGTGTLYSTTNAGSNWIALQSQTGQDLNSIHSFDNVNAWAVGNSGVISSNYSPATGVENEIKGLNDYTLFQNYPNPFNPSTKISFNLPSREFVTLKIYNALGREVARLLNEDLDAGFHEINFNASGLTSGVYFYEISTGNFAETKKMLLLK